MKRIGYLGDIHADDVAVEIALRTLSQQSIDTIIAVGDIVDGPGDLERSVALLRDYNVSSVRGNHERWFFSDTVRELPDAHLQHEVSRETHEWLAALPLMFELPTVAGNVLVCHGLGSEDMASIAPDEDLSLIRYHRGFRSLCHTSSARFVLNGHSHKRMVRRAEDRLIINAGTVFRDHDPSFGLVDFGSSYVHVWTIDGNLALHKQTPIPFDESPPTTRRER